MIDLMTKTLVYFNHNLFNFNICLYDIRISFQQHLKPILMCVQKWRFPLGIRFAKIITCVSVYDNSVMSGWCALNQSLEKITKTLLYHLQSKERVVSEESTEMNAVLSTVVALCNILCRFCVFTLMSESFS